MSMIGTNMSSEDKTVVTTREQRKHTAGPFSAYHLQVLRILHAGKELSTGATFSAMFLPRRQPCPSNWAHAPLSHLAESRKIRVGKTPASTCLSASSTKTPTLWETYDTCGSSADAKTTPSSLTSRPSGDALGQEYSFTLCGDFLGNPITSR